MASPVIHQSSGIIICKRQKYSIPDYRILMVKRQKASRAFPNTHVFPGGVVDKSDSNFKEWGKIFKKEQLKFDDFSRRICSVRELFEETNILLQNNVNDIPPFPSNSSEGWFIDYCAKNNIIPSIEKLIPFSQWITPVFKLNTMKRFDTLFYIVEIDENFTFDAKPNLDEISSIDWFTPKEVIELNNKGDIKLAPPTYVKILQMNQFERLDDLLNFSKNKKIIPVRPVIKEDNEGRFHVILPGDSEHPDTQSDIKSFMRVKVNNGKLEVNEEEIDLILTSKL